MRVIFPGTTVAASLDYGWFLSSGVIREVLVGRKCTGSFAGSPEVKQFGGTVWWCGSRCGVPFAGEFLLWVVVESPESSLLQLVRVMPLPRPKLFLVVHSEIRPS